MKTLITILISMLSFSCTIYAEGFYLYAWGLNDDGILPDASKSSHISPQLIGMTNEWEKVAIYNFTTLALKWDGSIWNLGRGTRVGPDLYPTKIGKDNDWEEISVGDGHLLAIKKDGSLWSWGVDNSHSSNGQLGHNNTDLVYTPKQIGTELSWKSVSCGSYNSFAIKNDGTLWSWGFGIFGQLGHNSKQNKFVPTKVGFNSDWKSVTANTKNTLAIKSNGTLWAWGENKDGILGDNTNEEKHIPEQIGFFPYEWTTISIGTSYVLAIKTDGTLWAWGSNNYGTFGNGTKDDSLIPIQIGQEKNWKQVSAGHNHAVAIKTDGTLWAWGENKFGQLGNNTVQTSLIPIQIGIDKDWKHISASLYFTLALKASNINNTYSLSGKILENGNPISNINVLNGIDFTKTNSNGEFIFHNLIADKYTITPVSNEYDFTPKFITVTLDKDINDLKFEATQKIQNI